VARATWKREPGRDGDYYLDRSRSRYRARPDTADGRWDGEDLVFGKDRYRVERTRDGIYTVKTSDRDDTTDLRQMTAGYRDDLRDRGYVPSWAIGTFRGRSRKYDLDVELRISESGNVDRYIWNNGSKADSEHGRWEDGEIVFGRDRYRVNRFRDGIETEKRGDDTDVTTLRRR